MARSTATARAAVSSALRARRIAAFATPATPDQAAPHLRWTVDQRCLALGVTLTEERRALARIFDETDIPMTAGEVWSRARALGLKASRSHVYLLVKRLLAQGVLIVAEAGQTIRYAVPLSVRLSVRGQGNQPLVVIDDPLAVEAIAAALSRAGRSLEGRDIEVELVERSNPA